MRFPFINLRALADDPDVALAQRRALEAVFSESSFIMGEAVARFEEAVSRRLGAPEAVGVDSGTRALELIYRALGIGPGDEVITTPFSFTATASSICHSGAVPVFADIDPDTYCLDPESVASKITSRTRAITPVHLFGRTADIGAIRAAASGIPVVEDACQAMGAVAGPVAVGTLGDAAAFSFFPTKNLGGAGDGGMVTTADPEIARMVRRLRHHGLDEEGRALVPGYTARLDAVQAAFLHARLPFLDGWNLRRRENAARYREALAGRVRFQDPGGAGEHVYHQFTIRHPRRDRIREALLREGIPTAVYYPVPLHRQPAFSAFTTDPLPEAETLAAEALSLPVCPGLTEANLELVIKKIQKCI